MGLLTVAAALSALAWIYLLRFHGQFWKASEWLPSDTPDLAHWPEVVAVIPARNEAAVIGASIAAHLETTYPGTFSIILVDDQSDDGTAEAALAAARPSQPEAGEARRLDVVAGSGPPEGWSGKVAAMKRGVERASETAPDAKYILFTDADIVHRPGVLRRLVAKAETDDKALVSLMAKLDDRGLWGGLLIPAFIFFFQKLYPFPATNDPKQRMAAAAGGCMLVRRDALEAEGGLEAIKGALIDDCALARLIKGRPPKRKIWLGLTTDVTSQRDNRSLGSVWMMVVRTAYTQLNYSRWLLAGTLAGMTVLYLVPVLAVVLWPWHGGSWALHSGLAAWALMVWAYAPTLQLYDRPWWQGIALPAAGVFYGMMTFDSARRHWRGTGGKWKGRTYPVTAETSSGSEQEAGQRTSTGV